MRNRYRIVEEIIGTINPNTTYYVEYKWKFLWLIPIWLKVRDSSDFHISFSTKKSAEEYIDREINKIITIIQC